LNTNLEGGKSLTEEKNVFENSTSYWEVYIMRQVPRLNDNCMRFKNVNHEIGSSSKNMTFSWEYFSGPQFGTLMMGCVICAGHPCGTSKIITKMVKGQSNNYKCNSCTTLKFKPWSLKHIFLNVFHSKGKHS